MNAAPPSSDRSRVLDCIHGTMKVYNTDQGRLNFIWWFDHGHVSTGVGVPPLPPSPPSPPSGPTRGVLDTSFGTNGFNTTTPGVTPDEIYSIAVQSDNKIVAGGSANVGGTKFALARYNADGTLDTTFGTNGFNTTSPGTTTAMILAVAIQSDGKIVVGGQAHVSGSPGFVLGRYNVDGSLDTTFGTSGFNSASPGTSDAINTITIQSDGKIVVGGRGYIGGNTLFAIGRYNADGSLDTTFGTNGFTTSPTPGTYDQIYAVAIQSDGKIVAGGAGSLGGNNVFALARYNANGSIDTSFGTNGFNTTTPSAGGDDIYSIAFQPDGKIVAGGDSSQRFALARYNANGSLDTTFGTNGFNTTATPGTMAGDSIQSVRIQSGGRIIVGGFGTSGIAIFFALGCYNTDGSLDTTFATDGFNTTTPGTEDEINSIAFQSDGKVVTGGYAFIGGQSVFAVARYQV
jgi:uncharacterized delta-60 repeat protein